MAPRKTNPHRDMYVCTQSPSTQPSTMPRLHPFTIYSLHCTLFPPPRRRCSSAVHTRLLPWQRPSGQTPELLRRLTAAAGSSVASIGDGGHVLGTLPHNYSRCNKHAWAIMRTPSMGPSMNLPKYLSGNTEYQRDMHWYVCDVVPSHTSALCTFICT